MNKLRDVKIEDLGTFELGDVARPSQTIAVPVAPPASPMVIASELADVLVKHNEAVVKKGGA
jgi:hypothetical protein